MHLIEHRLYYYVASALCLLLVSDYVGPKQKTGWGVAALWSGNKSMYTLMNVLQMLNSNQSFVPYRQSKVTRILCKTLCSRRAGLW